MTEYTCVKMLSDGVVGLDSEFGRQLFTVRTARKRWRACAQCGAPIEKGSLCWGPVTNGLNRMHRLCSECIVQFLMALPK